MSQLIAKMPIAQYLDVNDFVVVDQGSPQITRIGTIAQLRAAWRNFVGQTAATGLTPGAQLISTLPVANEIYTNDYIIVDQGTPPITRRATVTQVLAAAGSGPSNSEFADRHQDMPISGLPLASTVYLDDYTLLNQGNPPVTRRVTIKTALGLS